MMTSEKIQCVHLDVALSLAKAEGNLKFLSGTNFATFTQGEAVENAREAVQEARKLFKQICREKNSK